MSSSNTAHDLLLTKLADEFSVRYRAGERPSLQEYVDRYPELAREICELLSAMVEMEHGNEDRNQVTEQAAKNAIAGAFISQGGKSRRGYLRQDPQDPAGLTSS
jgi:hypothetical protein